MEEFMFIILLRYKKDIAEVDIYLSAHREFLKKYFENGVFLISGRKNPRDGGVIIALGDKREEIVSIIENDPFYINHIAEYDIVEFIPTMLSPEMENIFDKIRT
jgi:uncharacterized protein YciI